MTQADESCITNEWILHSFCNGRFVGTKGCSCGHANGCSELVMHAQISFSALFSVLVAEPPPSPFSSLSCSLSLSLSLSFAPSILPPKTVARGVSLEEAPLKISPPPSFVANREGSQIYCCHGRVVADWMEVVGCHQPSPNRPTRPFPRKQ